MRTGRVLRRESLAGAQATLFQVPGTILARTIATIAPGLGFDPETVKRTRLTSDFGI